MARDPRDEPAIPIDPFPSYQEPYVHIIAPNIDRIDPSTWRRGSVEGRRVGRALIVLAVVIGLAIVIAGIGLLVNFL